MKKFKIGYFGDGPWAHEAFKKIMSDKSLQIDFVCVRYDLRDPILIQLAEENKVDILIDKNINAKEFMTKVSKYKSDLFVSMSFNQIFKRTIIETPKEKTINCHAGKLPFYRGRNILNWALINDEKEFGITVHYIDEGIDTGDIILQRTFPITDRDNYSTLLKIAYIECANILYDAIKMIQNRNFVVKKQVEIDPKGFYCGIRTIGDENLNWNQTSRVIFNFVRAICKPGPQARSYINEKEIKINRINYFENYPTYINTIGQVVGKTQNGFLVKTVDTVVEVVEYEYDGLINVGDRLK